VEPIQKLPENGNYQAGGLRMPELSTGVAPFYMNLPRTPFQIEPELLLLRRTHLVAEELINKPQMVFSRIGS